MLSLILATRNEHKIDEIRNILKGENFSFFSLSSYPDMPEVVEDGDTFLYNARKKAVEVFRHTGLPSLADDSGLEVDALNGLPGVRSSRFSGENATAAKNNEKLLEMLEDVNREGRTARFRCVVVLADSGGWVHTEGLCEGKITEEYRGRQGFGYDPLFYYPPLGRTFAELGQSEKNRVSHRGIAFRRAAEIIRKRYPSG